MKKKKTSGGSTQEFSVRNGDQASNFKWYLPDAASDFVGVTGSTNTFQKIDPVAQLQYTWSFGASNLRYSAIQLQQAKTAGKHQLANYVGSQLDFSQEEAAEQIGAAVVNGTGDGYQGALDSSYNGPGTSTGIQPYGTIYQQRAYSGLIGGQTEMTNAVTGSNTHFGASRHLHSELVGNFFDASDVSATAVSISNVTMTNGSTQVDAFTTADLSAKIGWEIWWDEGSTGTFIPLGREYVVASTKATTDTLFQMSTIYRGTTSSTIDLELRCPYNATDHGAAGVLTMGKLQKSYSQASNGIDVPDHGLMSSRTFGKVLGFIQDNPRWNLVKNADLGLKGYGDNFMFNQATCVVDNNLADGKIIFENLNYLKLVCLEGQEDYKIKGSDLIELPSQTGHKQFGANKTMAFQLVSKSPRSGAQIINLDV
jgi:hypothetical protein